MKDLVVRGQEIDLPACVDLIKEKVDYYSNIEVNENNYLLAENQRKELTLFLGTYKDILSQSEQEYMTPYKKLVEPLLNAITELSRVEKDIKSSILGEKKKAFKEEVRKEFYQLSQLACQDGVLPDFESIYDENWYSKPKKVWRELLITKLKKSVVADESIVAYLVIDTVRSVLDELKEFLYTKNLTFKLEEIKGE